MSRFTAKVLVVIISVASMAGAAPPEDAVVAECVTQGAPLALCQCAAKRLKARLGEEDYAHFIALTARIDAIIGGASAYRGEYAALLRSGLIYNNRFVEMREACLAEMEQS